MYSVIYNTWKCDICEIYLYYIFAICLGIDNATMGLQCNNSSRENSADRISNGSAASSSKRRTISPRPESLRYFETNTKRITW